jgi:outer membrane protein assembly factor BamB
MLSVLLRLPFARTCLLALLIVTCADAPAAAQRPRSAPAQRRPAGPRAAGQAPRAPESAGLDVEHRLPLGAPPAAPAALDGETAYVPLRTGKLVAIDLAAGRVRWTADIAASAAPAAGGGLVFVPQADGLAALAADGSQRWQLPVAGGFSAPLLWMGGWLVAAANNGDVLCLRANDGHIVWTARVTSPVHGRPALTADRVYVSLEDGRVVALDLATGAVMWEQTLGGMPGPVLALDDRIFVGSADKFFYCLDADGGKRKWRWRMGAGIIGVPVLDHQHVYFVALDNVLRALHRWNGSQRWKQGVPVRPSGSPLLAGSILYVAGVAAELYAYRADSGEPAGKFAAPAELGSPPQLARAEMDLLSAIVLVTRGGDLQVLRRRIEPAIVPLAFPIGLTVPLVGPPVPTELVPTEPVPTEPEPTEFEPTELEPTEGAPTGPTP